MARYAIGIDLGTTHCALSYFDLEEGKARGAAPGHAAHPAAHRARHRRGAPAAAVLPLPADEQEFPAGSLGAAVGPGRAATSSASSRARTAPRCPRGWCPRPRAGCATRAWTGARRCCPGRRPGRRAAGLAAGGLARATCATCARRGTTRSPRERGRRRARRAGRDRHRAGLVRRGGARPDAGGRPQAGLGERHPARGAAGRALRLARGAGRGAAASRCRSGDVILVVDVGGGTSDFSLIAVRERDGELELTALAVGDHILLGGDNMDLALAHTLDAAAGGRGQEARRRGSSTRSPTAAAHAKEQLFADPTLRAAPIASRAAARRSSAARCAPSSRARSSTTLLTDGFFPQVARWRELPRTRAPHGPRAAGAAVRAGRRR